MPGKDAWGRFLAHEKLDPSRMQEEWILKLLTLVDELAVREPEPKPFRSHKDRIECRRLIVNTAMDLGIDLPAIQHKVTKKHLIGRGLLDVWNKLQVERYGSCYGTLAEREAKRRDIKTKLSKEETARRKSYDELKGLARTDQEFPTAHDNDN